MDAPVTDLYHGAPEGHAEQSGCLNLISTPVFSGDALLGHFLNCLLVKVEFLSDPFPTSKKHQNILEEVKSEIATFKADMHLTPQERINHAWIKAFRLELLLALVEPSERLIPELQARLGQADDEKISGAIVDRLRLTVQEMKQSQSTPNSI